MATETKGIKDGQLVIHRAEACRKCGADPKINHVGTAIYLSGHYVVGCYNESHAPVTFGADTVEEAVKDWNDWTDKKGRFV